MERRFEKRLIGYYTVKESEIKHRADWECAAWWEDIEIKPGKYPIYAYGSEYDSGWLNGSAYITIKGTTVADYFGTLYCGMPIGTYDSKKNAGKASEYHIHEYLYSIADAIMHGGDDRYEILPEFEIREKSFKSILDDRMITSADIYRKE